MFKPLVKKISIQKSTKIYHEEKPILITQKLTIYLLNHLKYCNVVCYREREREINSPTLQCLNQQSLRLTAKTVGE